MLAGVEDALLNIVSELAEDFAAQRDRPAIT
jgi:hypothetical protein